MLQSKVRRGELDREITFIQKNIDESVHGEDYIEAWTEIDLYPVVFARKKELPGTEIMVGDQVKYYQRTVFTVDFRDDITVMMRVVSGSKVYAILSITENEMGRGTYVDVVTSLLDSVTYQYTAPTQAVSVYCGTVDLSSGAFPTTGGTGAQDGIKMANYFKVSVAGTIGGFFVPVNAEIMAAVDTPGQTLTNWWIKIV